MDSISVDTGEVRRVADVVDGIANDYENCYVNLLASVREFTQTDWTGDDAETFNTQVEGFKDDFERMKGLMNDYASALRLFAQNYEDTQDRIKQQSQGLNN